MQKQMNNNTGEPARAENTQHTPGPWTYHSQNRVHGETTVVVDQHGAEVCECGVPIPEILSNARLIAAAPELLEIARLAHYQIRNRIGELEVAGGPESTLTEAREALATVRDVLAKLK